MRKASSYFPPPLAIPKQTHPDTNELHPSIPTPFLDGASFLLDSFIGHTFTVKELPSSSGKCINGHNNGNNVTCGRTFFTVTENRKFQGMRIFLLILYYNLPCIIIPPLFIYAYLITPGKFLTCLCSQPLDYM